MIFNIIKRNGYGSNFNDIYINNDNTIIKKKAFTINGIEKLKAEINFYNFIIDNKINIKIPKIVYNKDNVIIMEFISQKNKSNIDYFSIILNNINNLHIFNNININKNYYKQLLLEETIIKINNRYNKIKNIIKKYNNIEYVNNIKLIKYNDIIDELFNFFIEYINNLNEYILQPIHGDLQYNNIIFNNNDIYFIDPKASFGSSFIYGIKEYDIAKMYFSLSGYYEFDNMTFDNIQIDNKNNLNIDFINIPDFKKHLFHNNYKNCDIKFIKYLFISIWLSNAHIFINEEYKLVYSYYSALYFSSLLLLLPL